MNALPALVLGLMLNHGSVARAGPGAGLPKIYLTTDGGADITSKETFASGRLAVDPNGGDEAWRVDVPVDVRGRGNSTWYMPKRPYKVRLREAHALLGLPADREWSLMANFADKSLMRNLLANHMGARLGLDFTPRNRSVELNLNGRDVGVYVLSEDVRVAPNRLNLTVTDDTGGYLLEIDQRQNNHFFTTARAVSYSFAAPREPTEAQREYISGYVRAAESALYAPEFADPSRGYAAYVDVPSFIDWYLVNEILKNNDAANFSSIYVHKSSGEPLKMGPLWDFDLAAGNTDYSDARLPEGWWIRPQSPWFGRLFEDPEFERRVRARWRELATLDLDAAGLTRFIDQTAADLDVAQRTNFSIWDYLGVYVWPNAIVTGSYAGEVDFLKRWLITRLAWMSRQFD